MIQPIARIAWSLVLAAGTVLAQAPAQERPPGIEPVPQGFHIQSASASAGYSSSGLMVPLSAALSPIAPDYYCSGTLSVGYMRTGETRETSLIYDAEYLNRLRYSNMDAFLQRLRLFTSREVRPRWTVYLRIWASDSMIDQLLLAPTGFEFSSTDPMAPDQGAAPGQMHAASNAIVFGNRTFNASIGTGFSFRKSERLRFAFHVGGDRTQGLSTDADPADGRRPLMPQSTIASTRADIEYALSPRTDVGIHASTFRTFSRLSAFYLSDVNISAERRLSLQWFGNITGGVSMMKPVRAPDPSRDRQTYGYNAGATLGRRSRTSTVFATLASALGDSYGFGGRYSDSITLSASWHHPNRSWGAFATGYAYRTRMQIGPDLLGWQGVGAVVRNLGRHAAVTLSYGYMKASVGISGASRYLQGHTVQTTLSWFPLGASRRMN